MHHRGVTHAAVVLPGRRLVTVGAHHHPVKRLVPALESNRNQSLVSRVFKQRTLRKQYGLLRSYVITYLTYSYPWHSGNGQPKIMAPNFAFINCRKSLTCSYNFSKMNSKVSYDTPISEYNPHFEHLQATESEQAGQLRRASSVLSNPIHCVAVPAVDRHSLHQVSADYSVSVLRTVTVL